VSDNIQAITMPKWGLSMEEGMVVAWLAEEGNSIDAGQDILEIETTKITNVYEAPAAGFLRRQVVAEGETVPVGTLLGLLAEPWHSPRPLGQTLGARIGARQFH
jgi:pyruvate dehydrogenase E2 component (dihydrolipoamide acetyltransferase)